MTNFLSKLFKPEALTESDLPGSLRDEIRRIFPKLEYRNIARKRSEKSWRIQYGATVFCNHFTFEIESEYDRENDSIYGLEFHFIEGSNNRKISDPQPISFEDVPPGIAREALDAVAIWVKEFEPKNCEKGDHGGGKAFQITGDGEGWGVEVKLREDGNVYSMRKRRIQRDKT